MAMERIQNPDLLHRTPLSLLRTLLSHSQRLCLMENGNESFLQPKRLDHSAPSARQRLVDQAVVYMGIASGSRGDAYHDNPHSELWSIESATSRLAINSTLANLTIPFFAIDSFEWVTDPEHMLDRAVLNATRYDNGVLNYTSTWNPLVYSSAGYVALLPNKSWEYTPGPINQVLPRTVTSGTYYVAINLGNIDRLDWCGDQTTGQFFSFAPPDVKTYSLLSMSSQMSCIAFARVSLRAGAGICRDCRVASPSVLRNQSEVELVPDYLMDPSFVVMPTVTRALNLMNLTLLPPPPSMGMEAWIAGVGLERYVRQTLVDTYCATWNAFTAFRAEWDGDPIETTVRAVFQVSEASVDRVRVGVWLVLNLCVAMCCVAIVLVQVVAATRRGRRVVVDATLAAVLLDATEVVKRLGHGEEEDWEEEEEREKGEKRGRDVSNMSVLLDSEKKLRVRLRGGERDGAGDHVHLKLVPDT
ncbi:hypothetical protein FRC17_004133 [Serendipita sp. 399]|nr:hypothetical protein FRC17_004133 [Serendipita sp. 399]